jgi:dolichol-phosphate mannosyltransferase
MMYDITVLIPTYNEVECIETAVRTITDVFVTHSIRGEILIVDDTSTDGTINVVTRLGTELPHVHIMVRGTDHGLSKSVIDGFHHAQSEYILVTDADLQHDVWLIPAFLQCLRDGYEVVIGSRYMEGGGIIQWGLQRRIVSMGATGLGRMLFPEITDPVSGFFAVTRSVVEHADMDGRGYKVCMDVLGKGSYTRVIEIPYTFQSRKRGASKLRGNTIVEYALQVLELIGYSLCHHNSPIWHEWMKLGRFATVGLSGVVVNWGAYAALSRTVIPDYMVAALIAIELSIITNFLLNDTWTFSDSPHTESKLVRFGKFQAISIIGVVIQLGIFCALVWAGFYDLVVYPIGIIVAFAWNFYINRIVTWRKPT